MALLREVEGFMMDATGLQHHIRKGMDVPLTHVVIPLLGNFKGETGSNNHLQVFVNETEYKLKVMWWL